MSDPFELFTCYDPTIGLKGHLDPFAPALDELQAWSQQQGISLPSNPYLCTGFLIINLCWFREHDMERKCLDFLVAHDPVPLVDQGVLNVLCDGHKAYLPDGWGVFSNEAFTKGTPKNIHFTGCWGVAPWSPVFISREGGYCEAMLAWYACAKALFGQSRYEISNLPIHKWSIRLLYTRLFKYVIWCLLRIPGIRPRLERYGGPYAHYEGRFAYGKQRRCLSTYFWRHAKRRSKLHNDTKWGKRESEGLQAQRDIL